MALIVFLLFINNFLVICQPENYAYTNFNPTNFTSGQIQTAKDLLIYNAGTEHFINEVGSTENILCYVANTRMDALSFLPECTESGSPSVREHSEEVMEMIKKRLEDF